MTISAGLNLAINMATTSIDTINMISRGSISIYASFPNIFYTIGYMESKFKLN